MAEPEEEACGYTKATSYVVTCDKCRETEIRQQQLKRLFLLSQNYDIHCNYSKIFRQFDKIFADFLADI